MSEEKARSGKVQTEKESFTRSLDKQRALIFQGGAALGAYEAGAYKALYNWIKQKLEANHKDENIFDIIAGTSIGAISSKGYQKGIELHRIKEALQYFPDDYDQSLFPFPSPAEPVPEALMKVAEKWRKWYIDLMYFRNNSKCGRSLCSKCLLCTDRENSGKFVGISKLVARAIDVNNNGEKEGEDNSNFRTCTSTQSLYPCSVLNRFSCPYGRKEEDEQGANSFDVHYLFLVAGYCSRVESAIIKARKVNSIVPIKNAEDIYNALTDRETLDKLLQQGLDDKGLKYKEEIVEFFMSIKDNIRMEDLTFYKPIAS